MLQKLAPWGCLLFAETTFRPKTLSLGGTLSPLWRTANSQNALYNSALGYLTDFCVSNGSNSFRFLYLFSGGSEHICSNPS